jgi:hypothetical protein
MDAASAVALAVARDADAGHSLLTSGALACAEIASQLGVPLEEAASPDALGTALALLQELDASIDEATVALRARLEDATKQPEDPSTQLEDEDDGSCGDAPRMQRLAACAVATLTQPTPLASAYGLHTQPTHVVRRYANALDWICFDASSLRVRAVAPLPPVAELKREVAMPSAEWPSDHVSLACDLTWLE